MTPSPIHSFIGFFAFLAAGIAFKITVGKAGKKRDIETQKFLNDEHEANFARAHEIPDEMLYHPDINQLPDTDYGDNPEFLKLNQAKQKVLSCAKSPMLRLNPPMKNIEIKQKFGAANLEKITNYETSYDQYIRLLTNFGEELIKLDLFEDAKKALNICIDMESLVSQPYLLLCDIYAKEKNITELNLLKNKVELTAIIAGDKILSKKILDYANEKLNELDNLK